MSRRAVLAVDLGGTNLKVAVVDERGRILARDQRPTTAERGAEAVVLNIAEGCQEVRRAAGLRRIERLGVGMPGVFDRKRGILLGSPNLPRMVGFPFRRALERATSARLVVLENDANAAALGERWKGAGGEDFLLFTLGTGVGGGLILGGRLWTGPWGMGGEFGHVVVDAGGPPCSCGGFGCVETFASATAVARAARAAIEKGRGSAFAPSNGKAPDPAAVARAARRGDRVARGIFAGVGRALAVGIASTVQLLDLRRFVASGGLSNALDLILPPLREELGPRVYGRRPEEIEVVRARLGEEAGLLGAACLAFEAPPAILRPRRA